MTRFVDRLVLLLRRLAAFFLDYMILAIYIVVLTVTFMFTGLGQTSVVMQAFSHPISAQLLAMVLLTIPVIVYFTAFERSAWQGTPGKRLLGLAVVTEADERPGWGRTLARSVVKFLPWELAHTMMWRIPGWPAEVEYIPRFVYFGYAVMWLLVLIYLFSPLFDRRMRTPYDRVSGCRVVLRGR